MKNTICDGRPAECGSKDTRWLSVAVQNITVTETS